MIYLFCNEGYGRPFIEAVQAYRTAHLDLGVTLVFSSRTRGKESAPRHITKAMLSALKMRFMRASKASEYHLPVLFVSDINGPGFGTRISRRDTGIVAGFNQIFRADTIKRFRQVFNFHPSLLPFYRGPVPSYWCITNQEQFSGYTLHRVTPEIDNGEILYQDTVAIGDTKDPGKLDQLISRRGALKLGELLDHIAYGRALQILRIDAATVYVQHPDYLSFPGEND